MPPPAFASLRLRGLTLPNRIVFAARDHWQSWDTTPGTAYCKELIVAATEGAGLVLSGPVAVSADARISPGCACLDEDHQRAAWQQTVDHIRDRTAARAGIVLNHAGRRGATLPRRAGLDRPLREGAWPLLAPSALPYTAFSQTPRAMDRAGMDRVRDDFVRAARLVVAIGADLLMLHMGHGYLLASFLSPLSNQRQDEYGGSPENRMRFPLEVFAAVRAAWPADRPLTVALNVADYHRAGQSEEEGIAVARALQELGCDLLMVLAGQTTPACEPAYGRAFLTPLADRVRNAVGIPVLVGGYLTTTNEANTILAGGRADLCLLTPDDRTRREAIQDIHARWADTTADQPATAAAPVSALRPQSQALLEYFPFNAAREGGDGLFRLLESQERDAAQGGLAAPAAL